MKANDFIRKLLDNWPAKVICFVMALGFYVLYQVSSLDTKIFVVPLHVKAENGVVPAAPYPSEVKVTVRCKSDDTALLRDSDFYAYLDANFATDDGVYDFHVFTTLSGNALLVNPLELHVTPEVVSMKVEQQISAYVPVNLLLSGSPAYGYEVSSSSVVPAEVRMTGPHSMLEHYRRLQTKPVSVEGLDATTTIETTLENVSGFLRIDDSKKVTVQVTVSPVETERTFNALRINAINVSPELEAQLSVTTLALTLRGSQVPLEKYSPKGNVFFVNCASITEAGVYDVPLSVMVPEGFTVSESVPKTVQVRFTDRTHEKATDEEAAEGAEATAGERPSSSSSAGDHADR